MGHIRLAREADKIVIAPATGNFLAKVAMGLADDLATTLCLASDAPLYFVPAMNPVMWAQPATQANCALLKERGAIQIGPDVGDTACGEVGAGRMASTSDIIAALSLSSQPRNWYSCSSRLPSRQACVNHSRPHARAHRWCALYFKQLIWQAGLCYCRSLCCTRRRGHPL